MGELWAEVIGQEMSDRSDPVKLLDISSISTSSKTMAAGIL